MYKTEFSKKIITAFCCFLPLIGAAQIEFELTPTDINKPELAPFSKIEWKEKKPLVEIDGQMLLLLSINGFDVKQLTGACSEINGVDCINEFGTTMPAILHHLDSGVTNMVELRLQKQESDSVVVKKVEMTRDNWISFQASELQRVKKEISEISARNQTLSAIPDSFLFLTRRYVGEQIEMPDPTIPNYDYELFLAQEKIAKQKALPSWIERAQAFEDLDQLGWLLTNEYSYLDRTGFDYKTALAVIKKKMGEGILREDFAIQLQKFLGMFGDGHTEIEFKKSGVGSIWNQKQLPFKIEKLGNRVVALNTQGTGFLDKDFPFLLKINFTPVEEWLNAASEFQSIGTMSLKKLRISLFLKNASLIQTILGDKESEVFVELGSKKKRGSRKLSLDMMPESARFPDKPSVLLEDNIGYVNIPDMESSPEFLNGLRNQMQQFKATDGLIIDVRNNTGGKRAVTELLLPYFRSDNAQPLVATFRAFRIDEEIDFHPAAGYKGDSKYPLYPVSWNGWTEEEKAAINKFIASIKLEWNPDPDKFSDFHFFVVNPERKQGEFYYSKPVVVLMNENSFSATDIFLGAMRELPNVTLVGAASAGGSGNSVSRRLNNSLISVSYCTSASFNPQGELYDGNGINPNVVVSPSIEDIASGLDAAKKAAIQIIKENR